MLGRRKKEDRVFKNIICIEQRKEKRFYMMMYPKYFIYGYMVLHMVMYHRDNMREDPLLPIHGLLFSMS